MKFDELPLGLGMALAQEPEALAAFGKLSDDRKASIIQRAHCVNSKEEMQELVKSLALGKYMS